MAAPLLLYAAGSCGQAEISPKVRGIMGQFEGLIIMLFRGLLIAIVALVAPLRPCAAEYNAETLLDQVLQWLGTSSPIIVFPEGFTIASGRRVVLPNGETAPALEATCDGRSMMLSDRVAATRDLYPLPAADSCRTILDAYNRRQSGGQRCHPE